MLKRRFIKAAIFHHLSTSLSDTINFEHPSKFDPDAQSVQAWACVFVDVQKANPAREGCDYGSVTIRLDVFSRKQDKLYETERLADELIEALPPGSVIEVKDFDESDEPVLGSVYLREPEVRDETGEDDVWRKARVLIQGTYQES